MLNSLAKRAGNGQARRIPVRSDGPSRRSRRVGLRKFGLRSRSRPGSTQPLAYRPLTRHFSDLACCQSSI